MKRRIFVLALSLCVLTVFALFAVQTDANVTAVSAAGAENRVLQSRFLNMLNRNFVYNSDFESADTVVENSIIALLGNRDAENPDYIPEAIVKGFVYDMYGVDVIDISEDEQIHKDGFVYIVPRGFSSYRHKITGISENEDGSFTVVSRVTVNPHDDGEFVATAQTLFVKNEKSAFGYNIISSDIEGVSSGI